jgi:hypothetical protein
MYVPRRSHTVLDSACWSFLLLLAVRGYICHMGCAVHAGRCGRWIFVHVVYSVCGQLGIWREGGNALLLEPLRVGRSAWWQGWRTAGGRCLSFVYSAASASPPPPKHLRMERAWHILYSGVSRTSPVSPPVLYVFGHWTLFPCAVQFASVAACVVLARCAIR